MSSISEAEGAKAYETLLALLQDEGKALQAYRMMALAADVSDPLPSYCSRIAGRLPFSEDMMLAKWREVRDAFEAAKRQPAVIHFMGAERPWIRGNRNPYRKRYRKWLDLSAFAGMPLTEGREAAMQAYHLMNLATLWLPPVRKAVSRMFERKKVIPRLRPLSKQEI